MEEFIKMENFGLEFIKNLKPCIWMYNPGPLSDGKKHVGLIAQDVNDIVDQKKYAFVVFKGAYYAINYNEFIGPLIKSVQENNEFISSLIEKVNVLEEKVERLEKCKVNKKIIGNTGVR